MSNAGVIAHGRAWLAHIGNCTWETVTVWRDPKTVCVKNKPRQKYVGAIACVRMSFTAFRNQRGKLVLFREVQKLLFQNLAYCFAGNDRYK